MKSLKYTALLLLVSPLFASAQSIPNFPMALWGNVTINGSAASVGTVVRAYYGTTLAGQVTVQDAGVYGYTEPTKQKLVLDEGTSSITFTVQSASFNSGTETGGTTAVTYPQFTSGSTTEYDLAFTVSVPAAVSSGGGGGGGSSSGGGGGGGVGAIVYIPKVTPVATTTAVATSTNNTVTTTQTTPKPGAVLGASTYNFTQNLQLGSTNSDVTQLQTILIADGFLNGTATGYFGALTKAALKLYQAKNGISQTGTVGPATRAQLNKTIGLSTVPTSNTSTSSSPIRYVFTKTIKIGSGGSDVTQLQNILISLGLLQTQATGYFGTVTEKAVMAYQSKYGLTQTGTVGPLTRAQLNK